VQLYGWPANDKIRLAGLSLLEGKRISTEEIKDEIMRTPPAPGADDTSLRENYRGFIRRTRATPPPPPKRPNPGGRTPVGPNGNGGAQ
jgi:hypothetical protein